MLNLTNKFLMKPQTLSRLQPQIGRRFSLFASVADQTKNLSDKFQVSNLPKQVLINGQWKNARSGKTLDVEDPALGQVIAQVPSCDAQDTEDAINAARKAFDEGPWYQKLSPYERGVILHKIGDLILENIDELAWIESIDNGKPAHVAKMADCTLSARLFHYYAGWATKISGSSLPASNFGKDQFVAYTRKEPVGVVGAIVPWNFPLQMACYKLPAALAAGNCVVLKPAEQTPLSALRLGQLMQQAGLPDGVVNIITGDGALIGSTLGESPKVDKIAFTGSTPVGKILVKQATSNLKRITLELGGKSPNFVFADAIKTSEDFDNVVTGCAEAIFFNHGQCCTAGSRLYLEEPIFNDVLEGVKKYAEGIKLGKGTDPSTQMGPLINQGQLDRVLSYVENGKEQGGNLITGGTKALDQGYFMKPGIISEVTQDMKVVQEEIFGPVLVAEKFKSLEEAKQKANNVDYGLAAAVWSRDIKKAHHMAHNI